MVFINGKNSYKIYKKIVLLGAESTGKTTLCEQLAKHFNTVFVPEYARTYFETNNITNYVIDELEFIAKKQLELEAQYIQQATQFLFCDTSLITLKIWAQNQFNVVPKFITDNIKKTDYDVYLLCNNDVNWAPDHQRNHSHLRDKIFNWNKTELELLNINYQIIEGISDNRIQSAINFIK